MSQTSIQEMSRSFSGWLKDLTCLGSPTIIYDLSPINLVTRAEPVIPNGGRPSASELGTNNPPLAQWPVGAVRDQLVSHVKQAEAKTKTN